jgi:competence protein ComEA
MKLFAASILLAAVCGAALAAEPPKAADPKSAAKPDTHADALRTEPVKAEKKPASNVRLNLNAASAAEFARLPGVGAAGAKAIIRGRPYRSKEELLKKKIVSESVYEDIKVNVYAGR